LSQEPSAASSSALRPCLRAQRDFAAIYGKAAADHRRWRHRKIIDEVISGNPKQVEQYKGGKTTVIGFLVGQIMKASKGQASPALVNELLTKKLDG
jgi:aspartyl-tRNA(Asn)/glutamyl-tRNA(Gln) amidotransferase subunit B